MKTETVEPSNKSQVECSWVEINYWQYPRRIKITPEEITLEVTHAGCSHCHTCQKRVRGFHETLARKPEVKHDWTYDDRSEWLILPKPRDQDALEFLKETLDLERICFN